MSDATVVGQPAKARPADPLVLAFDLAATTLFAIEGAIVAVFADLDLFGILVIAFVTALGGGIIRDVLIGDTPPFALRWMRYPIATLIGGAIVVIFAGPVRDINIDIIVTLDAAALSLFAVSGARKAMDYELNWLAAMMLGAITAVGGGVIRDLLVNRIPLILDTQVYATAALAGAGVMILGVSRGGRAAPMMALGGLVCFALRMITYWQHWNLPHVNV